MEITHTHIGPVVIINPTLTTLTDDRWGTNGSIALALTLDRFTQQPTGFDLIWEWGADWSGFDDDHRNDIDCLDRWEPAAVRQAVAEAIKVCPPCEQDMDWYLTWADDAEQTINNSDEHEVDVD